MPAALPNDVVGIDTGEKSYLFYVYADVKGTLQLSYLESGDATTAEGNFSVKKIKKAHDPFSTDDSDNQVEITVSPNNMQVAAITWPGPNGPEIRVYYCAQNEDKENVLREVCRSGEGKWYIGSLSYKPGANEYKVRSNTSISATVHEYGKVGDHRQYNLRVFASPHDQKNNISVYKFRHDENPKATATWGPTIITTNVSQY